MTRRSRSHRDPTERRATAEDVLVQVAAVLDTVSPRERGIVLMRFGFLDGEPKTLAEIGQHYDVTRHRLRQIESSVVSKLRHPSRAYALRDHLMEDILHIPNHVRARILKEPVAPPPPMARCDRHGWFHVWTGDARRTCGSCPCPLLWSWTGRPASYCSSPCRQAAYRRRGRAC